MSIEYPNKSLAATISPVSTYQESGNVNLPARLLIGPLAALMFWFMPAELDSTQHKALAITLFMVINWIAEPIDHGLTALIGCYLYWALGVTRFSVAFSGFTNSTIWFLFSSLLMAEAASRTGLAKRLGYLFMRQVGTSRGHIQSGLVALTFLLAFFVPSGMGRLGLLAPLMVGILTASGLGRHSNFAKGMFVMLTAISGLIDVMVLSGATSMMTRGIVEEQTGNQLLWSQWLIACLPLNLLTLLAAIAIVRWLYPTEVDELSAGTEYFEKELAAMGPWNSAEKKALFWFLLAMGLWATDFIHRVNPPVIGLGVGLALSVPKLGVLDATTVEHVNFFIIIFSAGALGMGAVLMETNVLQFVTNKVLVVMQPFLSNVFTYTIALYLAAFLYHFIFANRQTMLVTSLPLLLIFAADHGLNVIALSLLWTIGGGGGLFVYQSGVYVLGYSYGYFEAKDFIKVGLLLTLVQAGVLFFLVPYYWPLIGLNWLQ
ncbi:MAG: SLC13 family permease [Candidatus Binatia bacterium]